jgi:Do/DeqQ family serine protease
MTKTRTIGNRNLHQQWLKLLTVAALVGTLLLVGAPPGHALDQRRETPVVRAVREVSPAVVNISSAFESRNRRSPFSGFGFDSFFEEFFKDFMDPRFESRRRHTSLGSGVIIDGKRGLILTNSHVIRKASSINVVLQDEREFEARIVGADPDSDLAVLKIESAEGLPAVEMGSSDDLMIGETVIAIGNPFGFSHTVTTGVISAVNRSIRSDERIYREFIQIDASINPGNSGGPLLNINGELIGINTAIYAKAQGIGFAIPINKARRIVADLIQYGEVKQAWIGLVVQDLDERLAQYLNYPGSKGVMVESVESGSPSRKAGFKEGDVIIAIDDRKIKSRDDYLSATRSLAAGQKVGFDLWREGKSKRISIKTQLFPLELADSLGQRLLGLTVTDLTSENRSAYGILARSGVMISTLEPKSQLARIGARPGDIIRQVDDITIENKADFDKTIVKYRLKPSLVLLVQRGEQGYYITVQQ